jgi:hypothetical protein
MLVQYGGTPSRINCDPEFASFNDRIGPLLASPSERIELQLLHHYAKG